MKKEKGEDCKFDKNRFKIKKNFKFYWYLFLDGMSFMLPFT